MVVGQTDKALHRNDLDRFVASLPNADHRVFPGVTSPPRFAISPRNPSRINHRSGRALNRVHNAPPCHRVPHACDIAIDVDGDGDHHGAAEVS